MRAYENEPIVVQREVKAVAIPAGAEVNLKLGSVGYITQALGGSFTVYIDGNLFRIAGQDADAIGKTDDTQFFNVSRTLVNLFELIRVNVLAVGIDDNFF